MYKNVIDYKALLFACLLIVAIWLAGQLILGPAQTAIGGSANDYIDKPVPAALATDEVRWKLDSGGITVAQAALAVTARDYTSVNALAATKTTVIDLDPRYNAAFFRFRTDGAADSTNVLEVYAANGPSDYYLHVGQITITEGTQIYDTGVYFCDTFAWAATYPIYPASITEVEPTNSIGMLVLDRTIFTRWVFIASTLNNTTVYVDYCGM